MPDAPKILPAGVRSGLVAGVSLPKGFKVDCRLGQLVDVRCGKGHRYLLVETETHWHLHRRVSPNANGHARNHVEAAPTHRLAKDGK